MTKPNFVTDKFFRKDDMDLSDEAEDGCDAVAEQLARLDLGIARLEADPLDAEVGRRLRQLRAERSALLARLHEARTRLDASLAAAARYRRLKRAREAEQAAQTDKKHAADKDDHKQ